jgi:integrase
MPKILDRSRWILLPIGQDQGGWLNRRGSEIHGRFTTRWKLPDGTEKAHDERIVLGPRSMGAKAAERQLSERIRDFFDTHLKAVATAVSPNDQSNFAYLLARVEADRKGDWKKNTVRINAMYFKILRGKLGHIPARDFGNPEMKEFIKAWIAELAEQEKSRSYIQHLLIFTRAAINEGMKRRLIHYNYANEVRVPKRVKKVDQRFMTDDEISALLQYFRENGQRREELILWILYACALRPGELFALRWNDWDEDNSDHLRIDEAFGKSGLDDPKTPRSDSYVYLPFGVQALLREWRAWCGDSRPEAFMFPSKRDTPMRYDNYLKRVLKPAAEAVGLEGITHQMLRRSFSTMALDSGASPKDVQGQMRHTEARMSLYYGKVIPASVKQEVDKLVDQMKTKIEQHGKKPAQAEAKAGRKR